MDNPGKVGSPGREGNPGSMAEGNPGSKGEAEEEDTLPRVDTAVEGTGHLPADRRTSRPVGSLYTQSLARPLPTHLTQLGTRSLARPWPPHMTL